MHPNSDSTPFHVTKASNRPQPSLCLTPPDTNPPYLSPQAPHPPSLGAPNTCLQSICSVQVTRPHPAPTLPPPCPLPPQPIPPHCILLHSKSVPPYLTPNSLSSFQLTPQSPTPLHSAQCTSLIDTILPLACTHLTSPELGTEWLPHCASLSLSSLVSPFSDHCNSTPSPQSPVSTHAHHPPCIAKLLVTPPYLTPPQPTQPCTISPHFTSFYPTLPPPTSSALLIVGSHHPYQPTPLHLLYPTRPTPSVFAQCASAVAPKPIHSRRLCLHV